MRAKWVALRARWARRAGAARRPGSPVLFVVCMATILVIGWTSDHNSCLRQVPIRQSLRDRTLIARRIAGDLHDPILAAAAQRLPLPTAPNCDKLFPDR